MNRIRLGKALRCTSAAAGLAGWATLLSAQPAEPRPTLSRVYRVVGADTLRVHIFLPPGQRATAQAGGILMLHGGGWTSGEPAWTFATARRFADSGLVALAVQYRLSGAAVTPLDALEDVCAALAWARTERGRLGMGPRIAGYGVSAGGQLIAATATVGCPAGTPGPDALVLWSPALDLTNDRWFAGLLQGKTTVAAVSPAYHVGAETPPTSIVHGDKDTLTPLAGAERYCTALRARRVRCDLHVYPGLGHLLTRNLADQERNFDPDPAARADGVARQLAFLRSLGLR
jgi:acetyl esterase/lipase